jgi:hypothetical protein
MKLQEERDLLVLTYFNQKGIRSLSEIQVDLNFGYDTGFNFDNTVNILAEDGYLENELRLFRNIQNHFPGNY